MTAKRLLLILLLAAFGTQAGAAPPRSKAQSEADEHYEDGEYAAAAELYLQAATLAPPPDRAALQIRAAEAALHANRRDLASQTLNQLDAARLTPNQRVRRDLVLARLGSLPGGPEDWLQRLPPPGKEADADLAERLWAARADAHIRMGDVVEAVQARVQREQRLRSREARTRNQAQIWSDLRSTPSIGPEFKTRPGLDNITRGWLELALLQRAVWTDPAERAESLDAWEWRHPGHPATDTVLDLVRHESSIIEYAKTQPARQPARPATILASPNIYQSPTALAASGELRTLGLILPLSGPLADAGHAIRDGFLAAWYEQPSPRARVRVFDSGGTAHDALAIYERALSAGADVVIGPLSKDGVASLARMINPGRPVLALNYLDLGQAAPVNFYQFGLAPEDEAQQVAQQALADGHRRAVALVPEGDWGSRTLAAFRQQFESGGGSLLDVETFPATLQDFSDTVRNLVRLDASAQREQSLRSLLGEEVEFSASAGNVPDFVFLAAQPQQARLIRPQFRFLDVGQIPIYATSLVYQGTPSPSRDADLEDIRFCDMPFLVGGGDGAGARERIQKLWPDSYPRHARLYAFGYDAAQLALRLARGGSREFSGVTGQLRIGVDGRVQRQLLWAQFQNGRPQRLAGAAPP